MRENRKPVMRLLITLLATFLLAGCTVTKIDDMRASKSPRVKETREGMVNVASRATGIDTPILGKSTVLTFPIGVIKSEGDTSADIMQSVGLALRAAGYNQRSAAYNSTDGAYLRAHVEDIAFGNFLAFGWATVIVHLRLETREGAILWKTRQRTHVQTLTSYDRTATVVMNKLVKDMTKHFSSPDFFTATQRIRRHQEFLNETAERPTPTADEG